MDKKASSYALPRLRHFMKHHDEQEEIVKKLLLEEPLFFVTTLPILGQLYREAQV